MFKNTLKRLGAIVLALAMAMSVMMVSAFAADVSGVGTSTITINKTVTTDGNTCAPKTTFSFSIATAEAGTYDGNVVYAGVTGGAYFASGEGSIPFAPSESTSATYTGSTTISTDVSKFSAPGIYHYTVTETSGSYEGISYDTTPRDLYVYVTNGTSSLEVSNVVLVNGSTKSDAWTNDYGATTDTTHDVTITKSVTGNQGDKNKAFDFAVSVSSGATGEMYKVVYKVTANGTDNTLYVTNGANPVTISIKDGGSIRIYGLTANDTYKVVETDYSSDGYTTTNGTLEKKVTADSTTETVTNHKDASTPTGVIMNIAPYVLMVALAGGIAFFFLRRRNAE